MDRVRRAVPHIFIPRACQCTYITLALPDMYTSLNMCCTMYALAIGSYQLLLGGLQFVMHAAIHIVSADMCMLSGKVIIGIVTQQCTTLVELMLSISSLYV